MGENIVKIYNVFFLWNSSELFEGLFVSKTYRRFILVLDVCNIKSRNPFCAYAIAEKHKGIVKL